MAEVTSAMSRGLMLDAWKIASESGIPLKRWPQGEARRLAARLSSNLGDPRLEYVLDFLNWRAERANPEWYFNALFPRGRWTPGVVLKEEIEERLKSVTSDKAKAKLLAYQAWVCAACRDFEPAYEKIGRALDFDPGNSWLHVQHSLILAAHDRYADALEVALKALALDRNYRVAVLQVADLLIHLGRDDESLELLKDAHGRTQQAAFPIRMQEIYSEREDHGNALHCLDEIERLSPLASKSLKKWIAGRRAEFLYMAGDLDGCLEWCDRKGEGDQAKMAEELRKPGARDKRRVRLDVPFVRQHRMTCAPATLSALAAYWGKPHDHLAIADAICHEGTPWHKERAWAESHGFVAREFRLTMETLRSLIDRRVPFTLTTQWTTGAHLQACIGYDERKQVVLLRDPTERHFVEMFMDDLIRHHPVDGPRCMLLVPPEEASRLDGVVLPDEAAYDAYHRLLVVLDGHDRWKVEAALVTLRAVAPDTLLALLGESRVAAYLHDFVRELAVTDRMLERAPRHGWMQLRKSFLLGEIGRRSERKALLEAKASEEGAEPVFITELGELLLQDARELPLAEIHLRRALRKRMGDASCYESMARCRDKQQRYAESVILRRTAACLAPDAEGYARAYFDSCRILRRTDEGLEFLHSRTRAQGRRKAGPWITLASCLDLLRRHREAVAVLEDARTQLPDDGELLLEAGRMLAGWGGELRERGQRWIESARGKVAELDWLRGSAHIAGFLGDRRLAILRWRTLLGIQPLAIDAWGALVRLTADEEGEQAAISLVDQAVVKHPDQTGLWALNAEWNRHRPEIASQAFDRMLELDPHDRWAWRERALKHMEDGRKDEALADAREALALDPGDPASHGILGSILMGMGMRDEARAELKEAIRIDIDYVFASRKLMEAATDRATSLESIQYIDAEMRRQVSNGEIVPVYQELAWRFVDPPVLLGYLQEFCDQRPDLWQTWSARVRQALQMRLGGEALLAARTLVEKFPLLPRAWMELAGVHRSASRTEEEEQALSTAVDLSPGWDEAAREHAGVLERMGRLSEAESVLRRALLLEPLTASNYGMLAELLDRSDRREEAAGLLRKSISVAPFYAWGWEILAAWSLQDGTKEAVVAELRETGGRYGHRRSWWELAADVWEVLGEREEALAAIRRGLEMSPEDLTLRDQLARNLCAAGKYEDALAACEPVRDEARAPIPMEGRRAWILMQSGQPVRAIDAMQALLDREPDYLWGIGELASWLSRRSDWRKLRDLAIQWRRIAPGELRASGYLGQAERNLGNVQAAREAYSHAHSMNPEYVFAGRQLADIQMELAEYDEASATIRLLGHYASSPEIVCDSIELSLKRGDLFAALKEAEGLLADKEAGREPFAWATELFRRSGRDMAWAKWLAEHVEPASVPAPGALTAYLQTLPAKRQIKEAVHWITREPEGGASRIAAWTWAISHVGNLPRADLLRKWAQEHRDELRGTGQLWHTMGWAMLNANLGDEGALWLSDWKERPQDMDVSTYGILAALYDRCAGHQERCWKLAAEVRREGLARFPAEQTTANLRASQAFYFAVEGKVGEAAALLAEFESAMVNEHSQQTARFAEAIVDAAAGRDDQAAEKARTSLAYFFRYPDDVPLQRRREAGEKALLSHQPWAKGRISRLRKKWGLPKSNKVKHLYQGEDILKPLVFLAVMLAISVLMSCGNSG